MPQKPIFSPQQIAQYAATVNPAVDQSNSAQPQPQPSQGLPMGMKAGLVGSQLFDAATTAAKLNDPRFKEGNPAFAPFASNPYANFGIKGGVGALSAYGLDRLSKDGHPTMAKIIGAGLMAVPTMAGIHNLRVKPKM